MFCTGCGTTLYEDDIFCSVCGKKRLPRPGPAALQAGNKPPQAAAPFRQPPGHAPQNSPPQRRGPGFYGEHGTAPPTQQNHMPNATGPRPYDARHAGHPGFSADHNAMPPGHKNHAKSPGFPPPRKRQQSGRLQTVIAIICIILLVLSIGVIGFSFLRNHQMGAVDNPGISLGNGEDDTNGNHYPSYTPTPPPANGGDDGPVPSARFPFPGIISRDTNNTADITFLQNTLNSIRRYYTSVRPIEGAASTFDGATRGAVIDFQVRAGLTPTGIVDETTWYSLIAVFENPPDTRDAPFTPTVDVGYVTLVNLHLREGPSMSAYSLGVKPEGTRVWVVSYIPVSRWFYVTVGDDLVGYMKAEFLLMEGILP